MTSFAIFPNNTNGNNNGDNDNNPHAEERQPSKLTGPPYAFSPSLFVPSGAAAAAAAVVAAGAAPITIPPRVSYGSQFDFDDDDSSESESESDDNVSVITSSSLSSSTISSHIGFYDDDDE